MQMHTYAYNVHNENHELGTMTGRRRLRVLKTIRFSMEIRHTEEQRKEHGKRTKWKKKKRIE